MVVEHLHHISLGRYILRHFGVNHLALCLALIESLLHHTRAHGGHLWTVVGINDGGNDITSESRANLIEQFVVGFLVFLVLIRTNLKFCTVGSKSAGER